MEYIMERGIPWNGIEWNGKWNGKQLILQNGMEKTWNGNGMESGMEEN